MPNKPFQAADASKNRLAGKTASDAFKAGNNAGMLFKKEAKAATTTQDYTKALTKLRSAESTDITLRSWAPQ